jgi:hypothetical protein
MEFAVIIFATALLIRIIWGERNSNGMYVDTAGTNVMQVQTKNLRGP